MDAHREFLCLFRGRWSLRHDAEQRRLAEQSKAAQERKRGRPLATEIRAAGIFTEAEGYHQKFYLQGSQALMDAVRRLLPTPQELVRSTLAARLNAFAGGQLSLQELERELPSLELTPEVERELLAALSRGR